MDRTADPSWYVRFLDAGRRGTLAQIAADPAGYYAFLQPAPGLCVLDVGAGTGALLFPLAPLIQPGGSIVGVDASKLMVGEATRRSAEVRASVRFQQGDAEQLDFPDASFDRAMATQLLVHLAEPVRATRELARVTRAGGLVSIWEADWETLIVDASDRGVTRRIANFFCDSMPQGWIGRALRRLMAEAGLTQIRVQPETVVLPSMMWIDNAYGVGRLPELAEAEGVITTAERQAWQAEVERRSSEGRLFVAFTGFHVTGHKG